MKRRWALAAGAAALLLTAWGYTHPAVMIQVSDMIWACFG